MTFNSKKTCHWEIVRAVEREGGMTIKLVSAHNLDLLVQQIYIKIFKYMNT
jgi:hypothetical protein